MHTIDARYMITLSERDIAFRRMHTTSHLGAALAPEVETRPAPQPRRRRGWLAFPRPAAS